MRAYRAGCHCINCRAAAAACRRDLYNRHILVGHELIDSTGTRRRLEALVALGYTWEALDAELEALTGRKRSRSLVQRRHSVFANGGRITRSAADEYRRLYDALSMRLPKDGFGTRRARLRAQRKGWLPPLAWDDEHIDNPVHSPVKSVHSTNGFNIDEAVVLRVLAGEHLPTNHAERQEILRRWVARGGSQAALCKRLGWKQGRYSAPVVPHAQDDESSAQRKAS